MPEKHTLVVLSTSHVSEETAIWLETCCDALNQDLGVAPLSVASYGAFGWFVSCDAERMRHPSIPADLRNVMEFSLEEQGARYLLLDRDADVTSDLPIFDW